MVSGTLNYLAPGSGCNRLYVAPGDHRTTIRYDPRTVPIADSRPHQDELRIDRAGVTPIAHRSVDDAEGEPSLLFRVPALPDPEPTPILRLRYQGSADRWAIGIYLASSGQYTESELPASFDPKAGTPKKGSMTPSSSTRALNLAADGAQPAPEDMANAGITQDVARAQPFCHLGAMGAGQLARRSCRFLREAAGTVSQVWMRERASGAALMRRLSRTSDRWVAGR